MALSEKAKGIIRRRLAGYVEDAFVGTDSFYDELYDLPEVFKDGDISPDAEEFVEELLSRASEAARAEVLRG